MKHIRQFTAVQCCALLSITGALLISGFGCKTSAYHHGNTTGVTLQRAAAQVNAESRAIDEVMASLNSLVNEPAADLRPQFKRFSSAIDRLEKTANATERTRENMEERAANYFAVWDKETAGINYGIVREQSDTRKAAVTNQFHSLNTRYLEAQSVVRPLISYLNDIRLALSVDLTAAGLESVKGIAENADRNATKVQTALAALSEELVTSGAGLLSRIEGTAQATPRVTPPAEPERLPARAETTAY